MKKKLKFTEPPPNTNVMDRNWPKAFAEWWFRKCSFYGVDPVEAMEIMLNDVRNDTNKRDPCSSPLDKLKKCGNLKKACQMY